MPEIKRELDLELCKAIMLWTEGWLDRGMTTHFCFDGHTLENIFYNTKKLANANLILVKGPKKVDRNMVGYWPMEITLHGRKFLKAVNDEKAWSEAIKTIEQQGGGYETLGPLKAALFAGGS